MSLSTLPSLCLLTILDRIPLHHLLSTVNLVCHRWAQLRPVACHRRRSLLLYDNQFYLDNIFKYKFSLDHDVTCAVIRDDGTLLDGWIYVKYQLKLNGLRLSLQVATQDRSLEQLLTLLPNISRLQLGQSVTCWPTLIPSVNCLLEKWSTKLVHLNLWLFNNCMKTQAFHHPSLIDPLFDRLNQLTSLTRLTILALNIPFHFDTSSIEYTFITSLTTVLSRVEHFEYSCHAHYTNKLFEGRILADLETVLKGPSSLKTITMKPNIPSDYARSRFSARFTAKLSTFIVYLGLEEWLNDLVISRLSSIESLHVNGEPQVDISFADFISKLTHLSRLTLLAFHNFSKCLFKNVNPSQSQQPLPQILSLKALRITFKIPLSHHYIGQLSIPTLFPNVQVIKFHQTVWVSSYMACIECNYKLKNIPSVTGAPLDGDTEAMLEQCGRQTLESLNKCNSSQTRLIRLVRSCFPPFNDEDDITKISMCDVFSATYAPGQI